MNVVDLLKAYLTPELISKASAHIGESEHATSKGLESVIPALLGGVLNASSNPSSINQIWDLINHKDNHASLLNNVSSLIGENSIEMNQGISSTFLNLLFGSNQSSLLSVITKFSGFSSSSAAGKILSIAGPLVLSFLKKKATSENYGVSGLTTWLGGYKNDILGALPSGFSSALNFNNLTTSANTNINQNESSNGGGSNWWMWLVGLIGLLGFLWFMMKGCNQSDKVDQIQSKIENVKNSVIDSTTDALNSVKSSASDIMNSLDSSVKAKWALLGNVIKTTLPGGIEINVPEKGVENLLISFINDKSKIVDKTTWFNFDRILFETGKSTLNPASMDQINNISSIMKAFPALEIKIGGYTDNVGDPQANKKLSTDRAEAVRTSLIEKGIDGLRMVAEGYGQEHPIGDNKTETGRDQNRRVAVRVTKK